MFLICDKQMQRSGRAAGDNGQFCHISISLSNKLNLQTGATVITYSFSRVETEAGRQ